ncbi:MAG: hypothetical protein JXB26_18110 [Candidatus Aminicenantes bacterium]|nr:hypothetical protein [Candidatus Aminicenantes bacterium]
MELIINVLIYCMICSVYLFATLAINPRIWMHRMPKAVTEKVEPRKKSERMLLTVLGIPFIIFTVIYPVTYAYRHADDLLRITGIIFVFFLVFDLWDTIILDLLIFCKITPGFIIIKGAEKSDYKEMKYHIDSGIKGGVLAIISSIVFGLAVYLAK